MSRITWPVARSESEISPEAPVVGPVAGSWHASPGGFAVAGPWAAIYRVAYERALDARRPSRFQMRMEPCWN